MSYLCSVPLCAPLLLIKLNMLPLFVSSPNHNELFAIILLLESLKSSSAFQVLWQGADYQVSFGRSAGPKFMGFRSRPCVCQFLLGFGTIFNSKTSGFVYLTLHRGIWIAFLQQIMGSCRQEFCQSLISEAAANDGLLQQKDAPFLATRG